MLSTTPLRRRDLHADLAPILREWIEAFADWEAPAIGEIRALVLSMHVAPGVLVYVSFIAQPLEPVLWEVSSGRWNPPAGEWLAGERARRIEALGFAIGGNQDDYQRHVAIDDAAAVKAVVKTVLAIFSDAFEYRGTIPFEATFTWRVRAERAVVFEAFTPDDVMKVFRLIGFTVVRERRATGGGHPGTLRCRKAGETTRVDFLAQVEEENLYRQIGLRAEPRVARRRDERERGAGRMLNSGAVSTLCCRSRAG